MNIFDSSLNSNRKPKYFSVEVITFDGESYTLRISHLDHNSHVIGLPLAKQESFTL